MGVDNLHAPADSGNRSPAIQDCLLEGGVNGVGGGGFPTPRFAVSRIRGFPSPGFPSPRLQFPEFTVSQFPEPPISEFSNQVFPVSESEHFQFPSLLLTVFTSFLGTLTPKP